MTAVTADGFIRTRLDERLQTLTEKMKGIFGNDIDLSPDSIDGQILGIFAEAISDVDELAEEIYQSFDPDSATGIRLARLVQLNGITKLDHTFTQADVVLGGIVGTVIPANSIIKSTLDGTKFFTRTDARIPSAGVVTVTVIAEAAGAITAPAGTLTVIDTPIYGWQTANNPSAALPGRDAETDPDLRIRRRASTATPGQAIVDSVYSNIANLPGVVQARVYENDTGDSDPVTGQPPHSLYTVVTGGDAQAIGEVLWLKKSGGVSLVGNTNVVVTDSQGVPHTLRFSRPVPVAVFITVNLKKLPGYPSDGADRIKAALVEHGKTLMIGDDVINGRLYTPANATPGHSITSIYVGTSANPTSESDVSIPYDAIADIDSARIVINAS